MAIECFLGCLGRLVTPQGYDETPTIPRLDPGTKAWRGPSTLAPALA